MAGGSASIPPSPQSLPENAGVAMEGMDAAIKNFEGREATVRITSAASYNNDRNINTENCADDDGTKEYSSLIEEIIDDNTNNNIHSLSSLIEVASSNSGTATNMNSPPGIMPIKLGIAIDVDHQGQAEEGAHSSKIASSSNIDPDSTTHTSPLSRLSPSSGGARAAGTANENNDDIESPTSSRADNHKNNIMHNERDQNIIASIQHRRKILSWVRACRIESQSVLRELSEVRDGGRRGFIGAILSDYSSQERSVETNQQQQEAGMVQPPSSPRRDPLSSAASEIADFLSITEMANRPPPSFKRIKTSSIIEHNPRDLRRGISDGKLMSNAESTSNHAGGGGVSMSRSVSNGSQLHLGSGGRGGGPTILPSPSRLPAGNTAQNSATSYQTSPNIHNNTVGKQFHKLSSSKVLNLSATSNEKPKKGRKRKANYGDSDGMVTLSGAAAQQKYPLHTSFTSTTSQKGALLTNNTLLAPINTLVPSLAAVNLLRRKDGLTARLDSLLRKKRNVNDGQRIPPKVDADDGDAGRDANSEKSSPMVVPMDKLNNDTDGSSSISRRLSAFAPPTNNMSNKKMAMPSFPYNEGNSGAHSKVSSLSGAGRHPKQLQLNRQPPPPPPRLPLRRKTHWDCVLDEMKWMATDFHEERKWKTAACTMLSSAVRRHKPKKKSSTTSMGATPTKRKHGSWSASVSAPSSLSTPKSFELTSLDANNINSADGDTDPLYVDATSKDVESAKKIARLMSVSILDHWDPITTSRYEDKNVGQQRLHTLRGVSSCNDDAVKLVQSMESNGRFDELRHSTKNNKSLQRTSSPEGFTPLASSRRELGFGEISSRIKLSVKVVNTLKEQTAKALTKEQTYQRYKKSTMPPTRGRMMGVGLVELDDRQLHAVHFLESLWENKINSNSISCNEGCTALSDDSRQTETSSPNDDAQCRTISAIVGGGLGIGKTVAVCALLWRYRNNGPQLIVCSPGALIRWRYELKKFDGLNVRIYSRDDGDMVYRASDIVVCDYGLVLKLVGRRGLSLPGLKRVDFSSMILDLRHSRSSTRDEELIQNGENKPQHSTSLVESVRWWVRLNSFLAKRSTDIKRLVIEQTDIQQYCLFPSISEGIASSSAEQRKRIDELLAMKVAFFYHPAVFFSQRDSVGKRVISWAKSEAKKKISIKVTAHGATLAHIMHSGKSALSPCGYKSVLMTSVKKICDSFVDVMRGNEDQANDSPNKYAWQLRMCSLTKPQQDAYNQCYSNVGGLDNEIACGLLKLRKICIHSNLDQILPKLLTPLRCHGPNGRSCVGKHGSILVKNSRAFLEPSIDVARKVMKKSSKMKELLIVLIHECGFDVAGNFDLIDNPINVDDDQMSMDEGPKKKAKVLILATLVEAQLLTSYFLSAVGLHHEVLVSSNANDNAPVHSSSCERETAWTWSQDVLSRFNSSSARSHDHRSINILVSSPKTISSHSGGIGTASADTVISIDEDWSGREAMHIKSIVSKILRHQQRTMAEVASSSSKSPFKFVKLVCHNTCENTFLCNGSAKKDIDGRRYDNGSAKTDIDGRRCEKETDRQCTESTRRSSRRSKRTLISNQDEAVACTAKDTHDRPIKMRSNALFCPMKMIPTAQTINGDGFLVPPAVGGTEPDGSYSTGCYILSVTTVALSPAHYVQNMVFNPYHLPPKNGQNYNAVAAERIMAFSRALFNTEDRASCLPSASAGQLSGVDLELHSITVDPTATIVVGDNYVRRYVESFRRSPSFIQQGRSEKPIKLCVGDGSSSVYSNSISKELCKQEAASDSNSATLLVYSVPDASKLKIPIDEFISEDGQRRGDCLAIFNSRGGDLAQSIFTLCFSSFNSSSSAILQDGNQGCEPFAYFPAFLSDLPQGNVLRGLKRKESESKFKDAMVETSRYSFREDRNVYGNAELTFHRRLLAADLYGALSCQQWPSLNRMILITHKKHQFKSNANIAGGIAGHIPSSDSSHKAATHPGKKPLHKKIKRHHLPDSSSSCDKSINSYFRNEHLLTKVFSVREGIKFNVTASAMGRVRSQSRLNDLVSNSFTLSFINSNQPPIESEHQGQLSMPFPIWSNQSVLLGTIPPVDAQIIHKKQKYISGITLPAGVKSSRLSNKTSSWLEESKDPWSGIEDSALRQCVLRYGMNWQLAANAVSSGMTFSSACLTEGKEGGNTRKRSAVQCQNRWMTIEASQGHSPPLVKTSASRSETGISFVVPIDREMPLFVNEVRGFDEGSSSMNRSNQEPNQKDSLLWLGTSNPAPDVSDLSLISKEIRLALVSRVQLLNAASKKRRVVSTPLPSSTQVHTSHSDAIQAARASMLSAANGVAPPRHEMWPLELLDFRKQHNSTPNQNIPRGPTPHSAHPPSQSPHRQQSSAPHHPPHTMHPSQHQVYHAAGQMQTQHLPNPNVAYQAPQQRHQH